MGFQRWSRRLLFLLSLRRCRSWRAVQFGECHYQRTTERRRVRREGRFDNVCGGSTFSVLSGVGAAIGRITTQLPRPAQGVKGCTGYFASGEGRRKLLLLSSGPL